MLAAVSPFLVGGVLGVAEHAHTDQAGDLAAEGVLGVVPEAGAVGLGLRCGALLGELGSVLLLDDLGGANLAGSRVRAHQLSERGDGTRGDGQARDGGTGATHRDRHRGRQIARGRDGLPGDLLKGGAGAGGGLVGVLVCLLAGALGAAHVLNRSVGLALGGDGVLLGALEVALSVGVIGVGLGKCVHTSRAGSARSGDLTLGTGHTALGVSRGRGGLFSGAIGAPVTVISLARVALGCLGEMLGILKLGGELAKLPGGLTRTASLGAVGGAKLTGGVRVGLTGRTVPVSAETVLAAAVICRAWESSRSPNPPHSAAA